MLKTSIFKCCARPAKLSPGKINICWLAIMVHAVMPPRYPASRGRHEHDRFLSKSIPHWLTHLNPPCCTWSKQYHSNAHDYYISHKNHGYGLRPTMGSCSWHPNFASWAITQCHAGMQEQFPPSTSTSSSGSTGPSMACIHIQRMMMTTI